MLRVDLNIRCSNRCAKPERPIGSSTEPTSYQTWTETFAVFGSGIAKTRSPFGKVRIVYCSGATLSALELVPAGVEDVAHAASANMAARNITKRGMETPWLCSVLAVRRTRKSSAEPTNASLTHART